jgi:serine/threonine-protein kinase
VDESEDTAHDPARGPFADDLRVTAGTDVGGYVIDGELGRGGMGIVYAATHPVIGKRVAIKVLKPSLSANPASVERFIQEARAVNQIGHPNIVDIFAFAALPDGRRYLVMDLLEGESLRTRVRRGPMHVREAAHVLDEVASALMAAHAKGFIHRDLKPDNIFLVTHPSRTDVKLLDFGLAKLLPAAGARVFRTATGAQIGTPDYMSPEQLRAADDLDTRTDVYSLGVTAMECLIGKRPRRFSDGTFDGGTPEQLLAPTQAPSELRALVAAMVESDPARRPTLVAVRALVKRLGPSLPTLSVAGLPVSVPSPAPESLELTASKVGARPILPTPAAGTPSLRPSQPELSSPALRSAGGHPSTTIGVPPPPAQPRMSRPQPVAAAPAAPRATESRTWLAVAAVLLVAVAIALVVVLVR